MTVMVDKRKPRKKSTEVFCCGYCGKEYKRESSLAAHKCIEKDKHLSRETREGKVAVELWLRFRKFYRIPIKKVATPYDAIILSKEFNSFMEFAKYIIETQILKTDDFVDYLFRESIPQKDWCAQKTRKQWILKVLKDEHPTTGLTRSIHAIEEWSKDTGNEWNTFFEVVSAPRFMMLLESGKISPWLVHAASTRQLLLDRLSDEEFNYIFEYIDPSIWNVKKLRYKEDYEHIQNVLKDNGL